MGMREMMPLSGIDPDLESLREMFGHPRKRKILYAHPPMSSEFLKGTTPIPPFEFRLSGVPLARAAMGRILPLS
jgi:hypothetical protein